MAVKRTNNVSSEISKIDRRVKSLESSVGTVSSVAGVVVTGADDENPPTTGGLRSNSAPFQYKRVYEAWIYGPKVTGNTSRAELYFEDDPEIAPGDYVRVQGINGNSASEIDISSSNNGYKVFATDTPPWDNADVREPGVPGQLRRSWRDTPPGNIDYTVFYNPVVVPPADSPTNAGLQLISTRLMDSVTASNTTVTVNFNSNHRFEVGDVLYWDLPESLLDGYADKLFKVSNVVDSNTVQYQLETPLAAPVSLSSGDLTGKFVYAVAQHYVEEGTTWVDTSVEPNRIYIWKDYRWYNTADPAVAEAGGADTVAPASPTNLQLTSSSALDASGKNPVVTISGTFTPPTTNADSTPLTDLNGYYVYYKQPLAVTYEDQVVVPDKDATEFKITSPKIGFGVPYVVELYAVDKFGNKSVPVSNTITTGSRSVTLGAPSTPTIESRLGTLTVMWNGLDSAGALPPAEVFYVEVHQSTTNNFTPSSATLEQTLLASTGGNYAVFANLQYNTTYYFKLIFVTTSGQKSAASAQVSGQTTPLVDTDLLVANVLNSWTFNGQKITAGALADGSINASSLLGPNVIVQEAIAANAIGANQIAANSVIAGKIGANAVTAFTIAANSISAGMIQANAIEADKIKVGALDGKLITGSTIQTTATVNRGIKLTDTSLIAYNTSGVPTFTMDANSGQVTIATGVTIGGYVTPGEVNSNVTSISGNVITTGTLSADRISAGSITADKLETNLTISNLIRTGAAGTDRIEIRGANITNPGIVHVIGGVGEGNFRFYTNGVSFLNNLELSNANLTGTLNVSGTISGGTIRTAASGKRVVLSGSAGEVVFYGTGGNEVASIGGGGTTLAYDAGTGHTFRVPSGTSVFTVSSSGVTLASGANINSSGALTAATVTATGNISSTAGNMSADGSITSGGSINSGFNVTATNRFNQTAFGALTGTTTAVHRLNSTGFFTPSGSDARLKENVEEIEDGLDLINNLRPVRYTYKSEAASPIVNYGLIAQEVRPFVEENSNIVNGQETEEEYLSLEYIQFIAPLISAVKKLSQQNSELQARIAALEGTT